MKEKILLVWMILSLNGYTQVSLTGNLSYPAMMPYLTIMPGENNITKSFNGVPGPASTIIIRCSGSIKPGNEPLYIIDGVVANNDELRNMDPNNIESITVLKSPIAEIFYGFRETHGVIIITTKQINYRTISVCDVTHRIGIPNATIILVSNRNAKKNGFTADSFGKLYSNHFINSSDSVIVSSVGYETKRMLLSEIRKNKYVVLLKKQIVELKHVVVESTAWRRKISCGYLISKLYGNNTPESIHSINKDIKIYPNPVAPFGTINLTFTNLNAGQYQIRLLNSAGQLFYSFQKIISGNNETEQIHLSEKMSAGIYIVQVLDEQIKLVQSSKVIIQ